MDKIKYIISIAIIITNVSCNCQTPPDFSNKLMIYIEARDGINTGCCGYGDVVVYDLEKNHDYKITDDEFYDTEPKFSPDGKFILFRSNRSGSSLSQKILGVGEAWPYIYDMEHGSLKKLKFTEEKGFKRQYMNGVTNLIWGPDTKTLLFILGRNKIYYYNIDSDSMYLFLEVSDSLKLDNLTIVNDYFCFSYVNKDSIFPNQGILIADYKTQNIVDTIKLKFGQIFGRKGDNLLLGGIINDNPSINEYKIKEKIVGEPYLDDTENIYFLHYTNDAIIFLGKKDQNSLADEIGLLDLKTRDVRWLTHNNKVKDFLDVYYNE